MRLKQMPKNMRPRQGNINEFNVEVASIHNLKYVGHSHKGHVGVTHLKIDNDIRSKDSSQRQMLVDRHQGSENNDANVLDEKYLERPMSVSPSKFAGSRFHDPPSPKVLPKPPSHWMNKENIKVGGFDDMTSHLKMILKVHVQA